MKTILDQSDAIFNLLNIPSVINLISGNLYKEERETNSEKEDIVVKSLTLADGTRQFGVAFVNIHVKDVQLSGRTGFFPNTARMKAISQVAIPLLEETDGDDFVLWVEQTRVIKEPEMNQHYLNIRLEVRMYNLI